MSDDLSGLGDFERIASGLLAGLSGQEIRRLRRRMAQFVRQRQAERIGAQQNPDGSAYVPRKNGGTGKARSKKGAIRRGAMFRRLRQRAFLQMGLDGNEMWVGYSGKASKIASTHQDGRFDRPNKNAKLMRYPRRILLGLTDAERDALMDMVMAHLGQAAS